jgi:hypothetical protein
VFYSEKQAEGKKKSTNYKVEIHQKHAKFDVQKSYNKLKIIYLFKTLFISFLEYNNAPYTFCMILLDEGWQGRTCN